MDESGNPGKQEQTRVVASWQFSSLMILLVCLARFGNSSLIWKSMGSLIAEAKDRIETSCIRAE
jgi:hypothetical protein